MPENDSDSVHVLRAEDGSLSLGSFTPELALLCLQKTVPVIDVVASFWLVEYTLYVDLMVRTHSPSCFCCKVGLVFSRTGSWASRAKTLASS